MSDVPITDLPAAAAPDVDGPKPARTLPTRTETPMSLGEAEKFATPLGSPLAPTGPEQEPALDTRTSFDEPDATEKASRAQESDTVSEEPQVKQPLSEKDVEKGDAPVENGTFEKSKERDPNIIDFDGPDDPLKAVNWPASKKWSIVATLSAMTFVSPLASSMFAPGVPEVLVEFKTDNLLLSSFVVSVYVLGYAAGPVVIAPLSELYGRQILYNVNNLLFIVFTIACAVSTNMNMLIGFRFLEGVAGSAVLTMGGGTLADLFIQQERGKAMAIWGSGPLLGPVIGPIAGGFLAQAEGWRWVFWVIAIAAGVIAVLMIVTLRETYAPIILQRKVDRLKKETGNPNLRSAMDSGLSPRGAFAKAIMRPTKMLIFQPIVLGLSVYNAIVYGYLYLLFTTITEVFEDNYHFSQGTVGLTFLGIGVGMLIGLGIFGYVSDKTIKNQHAKGLEMKPEYRLPPMIPAGVLMPIGLFLYGWTTQYQVFWFVPILGTAFVGLGLIATFMCIQTYLVDAFVLLAASAIAANTIVRSLVGALLPLAGPTMYAQLGLGWGNSILGFIAVALIPIPWVFYKYGERIRKSPRFQIDL